MLKLKKVPGSIGSAHLPVMQTHQPDHAQQGE